MSWIEYSTDIWLCWCWRRKKVSAAFIKANLGCSWKTHPATSSCAPLMKMSAFVHRLIWRYQWGCTKLQSDFPSIDEPGTLQAANPPASAALLSPGIRVRTNSIRLSVTMCRMGKNGLFIVVSICQLSANSKRDSCGWCLKMRRLCRSISRCVAAGNENDCSE